MLFGLIVYLTASFFTEIVIHYLSFLILDLQISKMKLFLRALIIDLIFSPIIYFISAHYQIFPISPGILSYLLDMFALSANIISVYQISKRNFCHAAVSTSFGYFIYIRLFWLHSCLFPNDINWDLRWIKQSLLYYYFFLLFLLASS